MTRSPGEGILHGRIVAMLVLVACATPPTSDDDVTGPDVAALARVEVGARALVLDSDPGWCRTLVATAYDADGATLAATVAWESDDEAVARVDADGVVCGVGPGTTAIRATADGVSSEPVRVSTAPFADGVVPVDDAVVVEPPVALATAASLAEVELAWVSSGEAPPVGAIVVSTGQAPILGRVVRTEADPRGTRVVHVVVAPWEALDAPLEASFPVRPDDVPASELGAEGSVCRAVTGPDLDVAGSLRVALAGGRLQARFASAADWSVAIDGTLTEEADVTFELPDAVVAPARCDVELAAPRFEVDGWLAWTLGGVRAPLGLSFHLTPRFELVRGARIAHTQRSDTSVTVGVQVADGVASPCCAPTQAPVPGPGTFGLDAAAPGTRLDATVAARAWIELAIDLPGPVSAELPAEGAGGESAAPASLPPRLGLVRSSLGVEADVTWAPLAEAQLEVWGVDGTWSTSATRAIEPGAEVVAFGIGSLERLGPWWAPEVVGTSLGADPDGAVTTAVAREPGLALAELSGSGASVRFRIERADAAPESLSWWCAGEDGWVPGTYAATGPSGGSVACPATPTAVAATSDFAALGFRVGKWSPWCGDRDDTTWGSCEAIEDCIPGSTRSDPLLGGIVCVPPGTFVMGCLAGRDDLEYPCPPDTLPPREVTLTRSLLVMETEVPQSVYEAMTGENPSSFLEKDAAVGRVSWRETVAFADLVNRALGLEPCGNKPPYSCEGWRLATEAEWEHAARGGEDFPYAGSNDVDAVGWYEGNLGYLYDYETLACDTLPCIPPAGCRKARNAFGLCDMTGNIWEWVWDLQQVPFPSRPETDPTGPETGTFRTFRGGSWGSDEEVARITSRQWGFTTDRYTGTGIRLVRSRP